MDLATVYVEFCHSALAMDLTKGCRCSVALPRLSHVANIANAVGNSVATHLGCLRRVRHASLNPLFAVAVASSLFAATANNRRPRQTTGTIQITTTTKKKFSKLAIHKKTD